jgi:hypothetical protein
MDAQCGQATPRRELMTSVFVDPQNSGLDFKAPLDSGGRCDWHLDWAALVPIGKSGADDGR